MPQIDLKNNKNILFIFILAIIGFSVASFLWYEYSQPHPIECQTDCELVRQSKYSKIYGIDMPIFGVLYYAWIIGYCIFTLAANRKNAVLDFILGIIVTGAFLFSVYLTYLEAYVIEAWCQWCVISAIVSTLIFLAVTLEQVKKNGLSTSIS